MKDPAFLFYPADWALGTMHMSLLEKGAYMELLMLQFSRGKFTIAYAKHMLSICFDEVWPVVSEKFQTDGTYYWNERLETEKQKRAKFTESRRKNANIAKKDSEHMHEHMPMHMPMHMENININKDKNKEECEEKKEKTIEFSEEAKKLYDQVVLFFSEDLRPKNNKQKVEWIDTLDKLIRIDQKTPETISKVIEAARKDDFWNKNFLSVLKLRKKNGEAIMYFTVFEKSISKNGRNSHSDERCPERVNKLWGR